jgi:hypothetical protein
LYYRCNFLWPNDGRFTADNFGRQWVGDVFQAIEWGEKLREEQLHLEELGVAALTSLTLNINRDPKSQPVKASDFHHFMRSKESVFPTMVCDAFLSVSRDNKMPSFVFDCIGGEVLQQLIDGGKKQPVKGIRALVGDGIALFLPRVVNGWVSIPLGAIDDGINNGPIDVYDVDFGDQYILDVVFSQDEAGLAKSFDDVHWSIRKVE